jgi:DGQHR domain-containing protein
MKGPDLPDAERATDQEKSLLAFLHKIGFADVNGGGNFVVGGRQIDAVGGHEKTLLVFECTTQVADLPGKLDQFRGESNQKINALKNHPDYRKYIKHKRILLIDQTENLDLLKEKGSLGNPQVTIWDKSYVDYYNQLIGSISKNALYSLLADMDVKPETNEGLLIPAFEIQSAGRPKYKLFSFIVEAKEFAKYCYVARRREGDQNYYQRMISKSRLTQIAKYIDKGMVFPNSIVVSLNKGSFCFNPIEVGNVREAWQQFGTLAIKDRFDSCWVIDGQHRLFSHNFTTVAGRVFVTAFANINPKKQAEYFLDINREAKRVDTDLLWDILGSINPESDEGKISLAVKKLRGIKDGLFEKNIKIPSLGDGKYSFNNICTTIREEQIINETLPSVTMIISNPIWNADNEIISSNLAKGLNLFFTTLADKLSAGTEEKLFSDGVVSVVVSLFKIFLMYIKRKPTEELTRELTLKLSEFFNNLSEEEIKALRKQLTSKAAKQAQRNSLILYLQENFHSEFGAGLVKKEQTLFDKISNLEHNTNHLADYYMKTKIGPEWYTNSQVFSDQKAIAVARKRAIEEGNEVWEHLNFNTTIQCVIAKTTYWEDFFGTFFRNNGIKTNEELIFYSKKIWEYRSGFIHQRVVREKPQHEEKIIKDFYDLISKSVACCQKYIEDLENV